MSTFKDNPNLASRRCQVPIAYSYPVRIVDLYGGYDLESEKDKEIAALKERLRIKDRKGRILLEKYSETVRSLSAVTAERDELEAMLNREWWKN